MLEYLEYYDLFNNKNQFLSKGDKLCDSCFHKRERNATKTETEDIMSKNWGLYLIPIVNSFIIASKIDKCEIYPDGHVYHIYNNLYHEQWSKNCNNNVYCKECNKFTNVYYELKSDKFSIF